MIHMKRHLLFNGPVGGFTDDSGKVTILKTDYLKKWKELMISLRKNFKRAEKKRQAWSGGSGVNKKTVLR